MRLWFKKDNEFHLPKAVMTFDLVSPLAYADPLSCNLTSVWVLLLRDSLQQFAYAAELAGLRERSLELYPEYGNRLTHYYMALRTQMHAVYQQALCLADVVWTRCQLLEAADDMTAEMLTDFASRLIRKVHIEGFMYGNLSRDRALHIAECMEKKLPKDGTPLCAQQLLLHREIEIEKGAWHVRETTNSVHRSSCASLYYSCGVRHCRANVTLELLAHTLAEPCFSMLRTKEQLGYIVFSGLRRSNGVQGFRVIVQSDRHPEYLEERIENFLQGSLEYLQNMSDVEFSKHRAALAAQKLEKPKRMSSRASLMWSEITAQVYNFDRPRVEVEQLNTITKEELIQFYKRHIGAESPDRQKLSVYVVSTAEGGAGHGREYKEGEDNDNPPACGSEDDKPKKPTKIVDLVDFKCRRKLYPHPSPFIKIPRKGSQCKL
ncbi:hypothetical protein SFRURICE_005506 [Spodoptera frugiperda]|nr:hypothetical protein SFRURICE_005506 [Spodoptera frugiperda]